MASLAAPRREARSARRRLRRHRHRNERIRYLLVSSGLLTESELDSLFEDQLEDIHALRVKALDTLVSNTESVSILFHLSQPRSFKTNRKSNSSQEEGKLLEAVSSNNERIKACDYRTVGEMLFKDPQYFEHKRNNGRGYFRC